MIEQQEIKPWSELPHEILSSFFKDQRAIDLLRWRVTCKKFLQAIGDQVLWRPRVKQWFPESYKGAIFFEKQTNWFRLFTQTIVKELGPYPLNIRKIFRLAFENDIDSIREIKIDWVEFVAWSVKPLEKNGFSLIQLLNKLNNLSLLDYLYNNIIQQFTNEDEAIPGGSKINAKKIDAQGANILFWAIRCRQPIATLTALIELGCQIVHETEEYDLYYRIKPLCLLREAVVFGNTEAVDLLLQHGAADDVNESDTNNATVFHHAAKGGSIAIVRSLLPHDPIINALNFDGYTPLLYSAEQGHHGIASLLLANHANANKCSNKDLTALHCAAYSGNTETIMAFLEAGAKIDAKMSTHLYPLPIHWAARNLQWGAVKLLKERGANIDAPLGGADNYTLLILAISENNLQTVILLLRNGANPNLKVCGIPPLIWAIKRYVVNVAIINALLAYGADINGYSESNESTPLHSAASQGHFETLELLLKKGVKIDLTARGGQTVLHTAVTASADNDNFEKCIDLLLSKGVDINATDKDGRTPLHAAASSHSKALNYLINRGANIHAIDQFGSTALHLAAVNKANECITLLLDAGANVNAQDKDGETALHMVANDESIIQILLKAGAKINAINHEGFTPICFALKDCRSEVARVLIANKASLGPLVRFAENFEHENKGKSLLHHIACGYVSGDRSKTLALLITHCPVIMKKWLASSDRHLQFDKAVEDEEGSTIHWTKVSPQMLLEELIRKVTNEWLNAHTDQIDANLEIVLDTFHIEWLGYLSTIDQQKLIQLRANLEQRALYSSCLLLEKYKPYLDLLTFTKNDSPLNYGLLKKLCNQAQTILNSNSSAVFFSAPVQSPLLKMLNELILSSDNDFEEVNIQVITSFVESDINNANSTMMIIDKILLSRIKSIIANVSLDIDLSDSSSLTDNSSSSSEDSGDDNPSNFSAEKR